MSGLTVAHLVAIAAAAVGGGFVLLAAVALVPSTRAKGLDLLRVFVSATLIIAILSTLFLVGPLALIPGFLLLCARIGYEAGFVRFGTRRASLWVAGLAATLALFAMFATLAPPLLLGLWAVLLPRLILARSSYVARDAALLDVLVFPILPTAILASAAVDADMAALMLACYILVEIFDSFALLTGQLFGRTPAFPRLSPRKTREGLAGGVICLLGAVLLGAWVWELPLWRAALVACFVGILAVAGDLAGSRLKRGANVKDFPQVLRRQGGALDSLDSWIAAGAGLAGLSILMRLL